MNSLFKPIQSVTLYKRAKFLSEAAKKTLAKIVADFEIVNAYTEVLGHTTFYVKQGENTFQFYILLRNPPLGGRGGLQLRPLGRIVDGVWFINRTISDVYDREKTESNWTGNVLDRYSYSLSDFCMHHLTSLFNVVSLDMKLEIPWKPDHYLEFNCTPQEWITRSTSRRFHNDYETQSDVVMRQIYKLYNKSGPLLKALGLL